MQAQRCCLVVLTDSLYLPGTRLLLSTWLAHHGDVVPVVALSAEASALEDPFLRLHCRACVAIDTAAYAEIQPYKKRRSRRHAQTFYKFEAFHDFGYERNIFLDSDILCLRPAPLLLAPSTSPLLAAADTGFRKTRGYKGHPREINSGVMAIDRSLQGPGTVQRLQEIARLNPGRGGYNAGDQGIINKWIHRDQIALELLPTDYNLITKDYQDSAGLDSCRLLHLAGRKPWF